MALVDGAGVRGATAATLWLSNVTATAAGMYDVVVSNASGSITSTPALLTIIYPPEITRQPASLLGTLGGAATFQVIAGGGDGPLSYAWRKNGIRLPQATNASLTLSALRPVDIGGYSVVVSSASGSVTSTVATLTLNNVNTGEWAGLVAFYPFTGDFRDAGGYENHAVPVAVNLALDRNRQVDQAVRFGGTNQSYVEISDHPAFAAADYSISLWFNTQRLPGMAQGGATLLAKGAGNFEIQLGSPVTGSGGIRFSPRPGVGPWDAPAESYRTNSWNHLVAVFAPSLNQVRLYLNGRELSLSGPSQVTTGADLPGPARLGGRGGTGGAGAQPFQGSLDEVRIYARPLPRQDAQSLYLTDSPDSDGDGLSDAYEQGFGRYFVVEGGMTWEQARVDAEARGGHLATITSQHEWECIRAVLGPRSLQEAGAGPVWLGASYEEGAWRWITGEAWQYDRWLPGEPAGGGGWNYLITSSDLWDGPGWRAEGLWPPFELQGYLLELGYYTNPFNWDTDLDGFGDTDELTAGSSPVDPSSVPPESRTQFLLYATTAGGGLVIPDPFLLEYPSNRLVNVTAVPAVGWAFMGWQGDASGSSPAAPVVMSQSRCVQAVFGTPLTRNVVGNGSIRLLPEAGVYPYGTVVTLVAEPQPGHYFVRWSNTVAGVQNPRTYTTVNSAPLVTGHFASLPPGSYALTIMPDGYGRVAASPQADRYAGGSQVTIQALPDPGQVFLGWNGDASGIQNPLVTTMDRSRVLRALFTRRPRVELVRCLGQMQTGTFLLAVSGQLGERYSIQRSIDLTSWVTVAMLTNDLGKAEWYESTAPGTGQRYYRVVALP
jgi:hypothetical protein